MSILKVKNTSVVLEQTPFQRSLHVQENKTKIVSLIIMVEMY